MLEFRSLRHVAALLVLLLSAHAGAQVSAGGARVPVSRHWSAAMSRADVALGRVGADHDDGYLYRLPYGDDVSFPIIQGYGAKLSHRGAERFTLDFGMPVGTPVHAARDGLVVLVEDSHDSGCAREECGRFANFVVVLHADGTTGEYFHLQRGSVKVRVGENVARGQWLARSGNTGFSTAPHLHFGVYRTGRDRAAESLAVRFQTRHGAIGMPRIEANGCRTGDQRIVRETLVPGGILDDHQGILQDGMSAERLIPRGFAEFETDVRFEPLPRFIEQRDEGNGSATNPGCEQGDIVERRFRSGVEDVVTAEGFQTLRLVGGERCDLHAICRWPGLFIGRIGLAPMARGLLFRLAARYVNARCAFCHRAMGLASADLALPRPGAATRAGISMTELPTRLVCNPVNQVPLPPCDHRRDGFHLPA
jgi:murein DD-endopeptidase MepM/ murein hydrolase activator NlpD